MCQQQVAHVFSVGHNIGHQTEVLHPLDLVLVDRSRVLQPLREYYTPKGS